MSIHLVGRNHHARSCLFYLASNCRVEINKKNFILIYFHSSRFSSSKTSLKYNLSSPFSAIFLNAFYHPFRGFEIGLRIICPLSRIISTLSFKLYFSRIVLLSRIPLELPICTIETSIILSFICNYEVITKKFTKQGLFSIFLLRVNCCGIKLNVCGYKAKALLVKAVQTSQSQNFVLQMYIF